MHTTTDCSGYETWLRTQGLSESTIHQRTRFAAGRLLAWPDLDVAPATVAAYLGHYHGWTRRTYHNHLTSLFAWAVETGRVAQSPMPLIRAARMPSPRPAPLTPDETANLLATADARLRAWLLLGLLAGLRSHEIAKMRGRDVTESAIYVLGKGGQAAIVPTHPDLWLLAQEFPRSGYWFPSPQRGRMHVCSGLVGQMVRRHFRACGVAGSIHRTRATYGTTLLRNGVNLRVIQTLMRHSSLASTEHYLGTDEWERIAAIRTLAA